MIRGEIESKTVTTEDESDSKLPAELQPQEKEE